MTIKEWLENEKAKYGDAPDFLNLDLEIILVKVLSVEDRSFLTLHQDDSLNEMQVKLANNHAKERFIDEKPLAYIFSEKEFYGRKFFVDPRVLIPRPETEEIIDAVKNVADKNAKILDVGTGSGVIAITLKLEIPEAEVMASDISDDALDVAKRNAKELGAEIDFVKSDLLNDIEDLPDIIVANLPYVDKNWDWTSESLRFEPKEALFAEDGGLLEIKRLIAEICEQLSNLSKEMYLFLELDPSQKSVLKNYVQGTNIKQGAKFEEVYDKGFVLGYKIRHQR